MSDAAVREQGFLALLHRAHGSSKAGGVRAPRKPELRQTRLGSAGTLELCAVTSSACTPTEVERGRKYRAAVPLSDAAYTGGCSSYAP
ncbi:hypothetical protein E5288_WYG020523 [Bos mutus]|uniref:Uncharacterized protein n=1 Tax=Bos mutus TaxID=72004 RepID=A0A6B0RME1_9CETA|nr:hypothetical protein [Bos mutus]